MHRHLQKLLLDKAVFDQRLDSISEVFPFFPRGFSERFFREVSPSPAILGFLRAHRRTAPVSPCHRRSLSRVKVSFIYHFYQISPLFSPCPCLIPACASLHSRNSQENNEPRGVCAGRIPRGSQMSRGERAGFLGRGWNVTVCPARHAPNCPEMSLRREMFSTKLTSAGGV